MTMLEEEEEEDDDDREQLPKAKRDRHRDLTLATLRYKQGFGDVLAAPVAEVMMRSGG